MSNNILYIEDNPDNMMLVRRILQTGDYNLMEAKSGLQGLELVESHSIDLILLDINLPDIDGYEVARRLRANSKIAETYIPIIVLSANAMKGDAEKAIEAGCDVYLSKPINIFELLEKVDTFINKETRGNVL